MNILLRAVLALILFAGLPRIALAQQDLSGSTGQLVCSSDTGACEWQAQPAVPTPFPGAPEEGIVPSEQPLRWLFGWSDAATRMVMMPKPPARQCPASPREAMDYMESGAASGDVNLVITGYDWVGKSAHAAAGLVAQMMSWKPGTWKVRRVEGRIGGPAGQADLPRPPLRLRWVSATGQIQGEFETVSRAGCWALRLVPISHDQEEQLPAESLDPIVPTYPQDPSVSGNVIQILPPGQDP